MGEWSAGSIIEGRYRLVEPLGQGGFGQTWRAQDSATGAPVALKQLDVRRMEDWKSLELFEREAKVLAQLDHPRIPRLVQFVPSRDGRPGFLVQQLVPGHSLRELIDAGLRFDEVRVRTLAVELLEIAEYLHTLNPGIIHRDIKPANVMIDDAGHAHLVDFGAVFEGRSSGGSTVAGTFGFMAPEQLQGRSSPASDVYGVGMTLVAMLTGTDPSNLEQRRLKVDFRPHVHVTPEFADWLDRCIEPTLEDRFPSARDALDALMHVISPQALVASLETPAGGALSSRFQELERQRADAERQRALAVQSAESRALQSYEMRAPRTLLKKHGPNALDVTFTRRKLRASTIGFFVTASVILYLATYNYLCFTYAWEWHMAALINLVVHGSIWGSVLVSGLVGALLALIPKSILPAAPEFRIRVSDGHYQIFEYEGRRGKEVGIGPIERLGLEATTFTEASLPEAQATQSYLDVYYQDVANGSSAHARVDELASGDLALVREAFGDRLRAD